MPWLTNVFKMLPHGVRHVVYTVFYSFYPHAIMPCMYSFLMPFLIHSTCMICLLCNFQVHECWRHLPYINMKVFEDTLFIYRFYCWYLGQAFF